MQTKSIENARESLQCSLSGIKLGSFFYFTPNLPPLPKKMVKCSSFKHILVTCNTILKMDKLKLDVESYFFFWEPFIYVIAKLEH